MLLTIPEQFLRLAKYEYGKSESAVSFGPDAKILSTITRGGGTQAVNPPAGRPLATDLLLINLFVKIWE